MSFNEDSRVKIAAILHLSRMGFTTNQTPLKTKECLHRAFKEAATTKMEPTHPFKPE